MRKTLESKCDYIDLNGIYNELADLFDVEVAKKIFDEYRGQQITFPMEFYNKQ